MKKAYQYLRVAVTFTTLPPGAAPPDQRRVMRKSTQRVSAVDIRPIVVEGPPPSGTETAAVIKKERFSSERPMSPRQGEVAALRRLLDNASIEELWEVPG